MNADLANDIGNLAQRSLTMIAKNCARRTPDWRAATPTQEDLAMLARADALLGEARRHMQSFALASLHRRRVRGRVGGQSLFRQRRALEARQERSRAHGARALRDDRNLAHRRDPAAAGDARAAWAGCSTCSASRRRPAHSRRWTPASGAGRLDASASARAGQGAAPACAGLSLATSKRSRRSDAGVRRVSRAPNDNHRQPLPSRFSRLRRGPRRVVERARAAGVERMITIATKVSKAARRGRDRRALRRRLLHRRHASA